VDKCAMYLCYVVVKKDGVLRKVLDISMGSNCEE